MVSITVTDAWRKTHIGAIIGILEISGIDNSSGSSWLNSQKEVIQSQLRETYNASSRQDILAHPVMTAYTRYYKQFRKTYHVLLQVESIIFKGRGLPTISPLVDANFMAEMDTFILSAGHEVEELKGPIVMDVSREDDSITQMNGNKKTILAGDMIMRDKDIVSCSIIYGQDDRSPITQKTTHVLYVAYAPPGIHHAQVKDHLRTIESHVHLFSSDSITEQLSLFSADGHD